MVKIEIVVTGSTVLQPLHWLSSTKVRVTDESTGKSKIIIFADSSIPDSEVATMENHFEQMKTDCCNNFVELYSNKDYAEFLKSYEKEFPSRNTYDCITKNCATAGNFVLDYFFPEPTCGSAFYKKVQTVLGFTSLISCGLFRCFPSIPCVNTPTDVLRKAQLLSLRYGAKAKDPSLEKSLGEREQEEKNSYSVIAM